MADLAYYLRISNHLAGNLDIRSALRSVKSEIEKILPIDHLDVCLIDEQAHWNYSYEVGLETSWSTKSTPVNVSPIRDILNGKCDSMITDNAMEDPRYLFDGAASAPILEHKLRSRVNVSMKVLGRTIGSLNCSSRKVGLYNKRTLEQVRNIADILAPYFYALRANETANREAVIRTEIQAREEGLRLGALSLTDELEAERQRIGMDLHDQTLADLTRIARDLEGPTNRAEIKKLQRRIQECIQGLRDIIDMSIPSLLELFGFQHAVRTHIERALGENSSVVFEINDLSNGGIDLLPNTTRIALFRIAQEAINNAVQHANPSQITVDIDDRDAFFLVVKDDGDFDSSEALKRVSGGLTHMRTRARLINATFEMTYKNGTSVCVQLPHDTKQKSEVRP